MQLSEDQKLQIFRNGFTIVPGAVSPQLIDSALRIINSTLGKGVTEAEAAKSRQTSTWCESIARTPELTNLFNASHAISLVSSAIGTVRQVGAAQIALRHPGTNCLDDVNFTIPPNWYKGWHIDGWKQEKGVSEGYINNFTCLVGVLLSDLPAEYNGNLTVYPGSHHVIERWFRDSGFVDPQTKQYHRLPPNLPFAAPHQVTGKAGDIIIAHYQLAHCVAPNVGPHIRYTVYFRIHGRPHKGVFDAEPMLDIWLDWKLFSDVVARERARLAGSRDAPPMPDLSLLTPAKHAESPAAAGLMSRPPPPLPPKLPTPTGVQAGGPPAPPTAIPPSPTELITDAEAAKLRPEADALFSKKQFQAAQPLFKKLHHHAPRDWVLLIKLGACLTFGGDAAQLPEGEMYLRKLTDMLPGASRGFMLLAQNLSRQGKQADCVEAVRRGLQCHPQDEAPDYIIDGLKAARQALRSLTRDKEFDQLLADARRMYPKLASQLDELGSGIDVEQLKVEGGKLMQQKNFAEAVAIFEKLVAARPNDYWLTYNLAVCLTWSNRAPEAEPWIHQAIALDPKLPNAHTLLVRNYAAQRMPDKVSETAEKMLDQQLHDRDYSDKALEVLTCVKNTVGKGPRLEALVRKAKARYPSAAGLFDGLLL